MLLVSLFLSGWIWIYAMNPTTNHLEKTIIIPKGSGTRHIKSILVENGILSDDVRFLILAQISGSATKLRAGEYLIPPNLTPLEILKLIERGEVIYHKVTIPEGKTIKQIAEILEKENWIDPKRFIRLTQDADFIKNTGLEIENLEGYLFPDTYLLTRNTVTEESLIIMMVRHFQDTWDKLENRKQTSLSPHQVVTLASIIEKETGVPEERPLIAGVFLNRLDKNMRLQSDPTVIYGLDNFDGNLTRKDLKTPTQYNTYVINGLPPGPICNPGQASLQAVLKPAVSKYLYFVSKNDGSHHFSESLREHNRAVRKYQLRRKKITKVKSGN